MPFETKKIKTETLGEYLSGVRKTSKISVENVSKSTGVPSKFLEFMEAGQFASLPPTVYAAGFLKKLAKLYHVSADTLIAQFKKERVLAQEMGKEHAPKKVLYKRFLDKFVVTPKSLSLVVGGVFIVVTISYIVFQILSIYGAPKLAVLEPQDGQKISGSAVSVSGETEPGVTLTINDQSVFVEASGGKFHTMVSVAGGQKDLVFVASNKFNKTTTKTVSVLVNSKTSDSVGSPQAENSALTLILNFTDSADISFSTDGREPAFESVTAGSSKTIVANTKILLSTSNAGATQAKFNNKLLGALGKKNETLTNIPFTSDTGVILSANKK